MKRSSFFGELVFNRHEPLNGLDQH